MTSYHPQQRRPPVTTILLTWTGIIGKAKPIGSLQDEVANRIGLPADAPQVMIDSGRGLHLAVRRRRKTEIQWCVAKLTQVIEQPDYLVHDRRPFRFQLLRAFPGEPYFALRVVIKHVPPSRSAAGRHELWVQTAHPLGEVSYRRMTNSLSPFRAS